MKIKQLFFAATLALLFNTVMAQSEIPAGYAKGTITLADGSTLQGLVKDNIKKSASVVYINEARSNKKLYNGSEINGVTVNGENYICIHGDFFKTLSAGKLNFLQKASNAAGQVSYNGSEAVVNNGTEGKIGSYFVYSGKTLKLLTKKNIESFINNDLSGCAAAIEKAKGVNGDVAKLQEAVEIYNSSN